MGSVFRCIGARLAGAGAIIATRYQSNHCVPLTCRTLLRMQQNRYRTFSTTTRRPDGNANDKDRAKEISQRDLRRDGAKVAARNQDSQPWHRDGAGKILAEQERGQDNESPRGKLLTTPTRLLKLILPLPMHPGTKITKPGDKDREPLALLVHPQQPLSYLERLLQTELLPLKDDHGREKMPGIYFRAEDAAHGDNLMQAKEGKSGGNGNVASYSGLGHLGPQKENTSWVRWSSSTEVGDFIRDAARGREFAIEIEGYGAPNDEADSNVGEVRVSVPSFRDRTHYMRQRLRNMSRRIDAMSRLKTECDEAAHRGAHRLAQGGFVGLVAWWGVVYYTSFKTDYGWDLVEPITYLAGLTTIMGGYLWFLYVSRDLSYRAALNVTVSRRQNALYKERGFDLQRWEQMVHEANALRREIRTVADEYDVDWDEKKDLGGEDVKNVLENEEEDGVRARKRGKNQEQRHKDVEKEQRHKEAGKEQREKRGDKK